MDEKSYKYIWAWGHMLGSFPAYVEREVEKARLANAPETAIYQKQDGTWAIFEDIQSENTKAWIQKHVQRMGQ